MKTEIIKKSFLLHIDLIDSVGHLSDEKLGELFRAILEFHNTKNTTGKIGTTGTTGKKLSPEIDMAFNFLKVQFERENQKYEVIVERNRNNISKRWESKNTKNTTGKSGIPKIPEASKNTDSDSDNDIIKKDNTSVLSKEKPTLKLKKLEIPNLEEVKAYASEAKLLCNYEKFFDHFTANGWKQSNKNPIIDWKAALRNWDRNESRFASPDELKTKQEAVQALTPREESEIGRIHKKIIEEQGIKGYEVDSFKKRFSIMEKREDGLYVIAKHPIEIEVFRNNYRKILNQYSIKVEARYEDAEPRKSLIN